MPELVKIIKNKKEPIEVFYTDDEEFSVINLVKNLVGYKESVESITNSLKNFVEANPNKKLRILEYSTRDSELTYGVFNELKAYVTEYIYVDDSVYYETKLSGLKEHDEFKYVNFNDELKNKFEEDYFDVIIALNSIHRSENAKARAEELISILKPYGLLVGNEINKPNLLPLITADILNTQNFSAENEINIKTDKSEIIYESNADKLAITNFNTFFVRKFKNSKISFDNLKNYLSKEIPGYMIPTYFYHVNEIPLNKNGKADRKKLKNNILKNNAVSNKVLVEQTKPKTETEKTLLNIWKDSLNNEDISINDNYFSVGGDSLTATSITGKVRKELGLEISIKDIFQNSSIAALSEFIDDNMGSLSIKTDSVAIIPDKKHLYEPFPLTDVQMAYWIGRQGAYNLGNVSTHCYFEFDCLNLKISKLQEVLNDMVTYHPALRTIVMKSGEQKILKEVSYFLVNVNDITTLREVIKEEILQQIREELSHRIIDLSQFPTFDFKVARISWNTFRVFIGLDNTILDGWSMFEFLKEIKSRYEGDFNEENIGVTFRDYVLYKNRADNINFERDKVYWLNRLDSFPNMPKLFFMKNDSSKIDQKFNRKEAKIEKEDWLKFKNIATQSEVTPTALLLSLFSVILSKYSNEDNFVINMTQFIKKDVHPQIYKVTGDFTELSLLEIKLDKNNTIIENANKIQHQLISDMEHSSYSSIEFLRELRKQKDVNNIAPIVFTSGLGIKGNRSKDFLGNLNYAISQTPQIWLDHQVIEVDGDLILVWDYVTGIFDNNEIDACFEDYVSIVKEFVINENMQTRYFSELNENHLQNDGVKYSFSEGNVDFKSKDKTSVSLEVENKSDSNGLYYEGLKQEIKGLFKEILELDEIKDDDNFFSLGGNSLNMIQLSNKLLDKYKYQLDFSEFLENATVFYIVSETTKYLMGE